ncbi:MAG: hypothetical protein GC192_05515 [Bacteroidetes bacterium]|nr:hypothetical protein [Bacteroidota bacterium]
MKYEKLSPPLATPIAEICKCPGRPPIVLQSRLNYNPLSCADCNLEIDLDKITLDERLVGKIADWRNFHDCFYRLWLDSEEFENWAKEQLITPNSPLNKRGLSVKDEIGKSYKWYYWWFSDEESRDNSSTMDCPKCHNKLIKREDNYSADTFLCEICGVIIAV